MADSVFGPMGSGIETDIVSGRPVKPRTPEDRAAVAKASMDDAVMRAISLQADLAQSPVLGLLLKQFTNRLEILAKEDVVCQNLLAVLMSIRNIIDVVPEYAHRRFKDILGATAQVAPLAVTDPAAQAIPGSE